MRADYGARSASATQLESGSPQQNMRKSLESRMALVDIADAALERLEALGEDTTELRRDLAFARADIPGQRRKQYE